MNDRETYFEEAFPEYKFEPTTLDCGHILEYTCPTCEECYQCKHKVQARGDGTLWWRCRNGAKHRVIGAMKNCSKCNTIHKGDCP